MCRHEHMIRPAGPIPKRHLRGDTLHRGRHQRPRVADGGKPVNGAEVAGDVNRHEEEIGLPRVEGPKPTTQQGLVDGDLGGEEVGVAALVGEPVSVVFGWKVVDIELDVGGK